MAGETRGILQRVVRLLKIGWLCFWVGTATFLAFFPVVATARIDPSQRKTQFVVRIWYRMILTAAGVRTRSTGTEKIRKDRSYAIISNHQSHFDILALVAELPVIVRFVAKKELRRIPVFGYAVELTRCIFVDRSNTAEAVKKLQSGIRDLPPTVSMLFFAEGTRSEDGRIGPFKKGGFRTAQMAGWPLLPVVVRGGAEVLPKGELAFRSGTIEVEVLDPVPSEEVARRPLEDLMEEVRNRIVTHYEKAVRPI
jgi:1-acyl-sn-glycerol-3-phosphate acyltransferase